MTIFDDRLVQQVVADRSLLAERLLSQTQRTCVHQDPKQIACNVHGLCPVLSKDGEHCMAGFTVKWRTKDGLVT